MKGSVLESYSVVIGHPSKEVFVVAEHNLSAEDARAVVQWYLRRGRPAFVQPQGFPHPLRWQASECPHCRSEAASCLSRARESCV